MGRNKKKSKQHHSSSDDEGDEVLSQQGSVEAQAEAAPAAAAAAEQDPPSDADSDDKPKKKKEYRGNKLNRQQGKGKKNKGGKDEAAEVDGKDEAAANNDEDGGSDADDGEIIVTRQGPVEVLYCPICTFPAEMCEFSGMLEKCRPWLLEHAADLAAAEERGRKRRILTAKERLDAMMEGRGIKKALERVVVLDVEKRTGRRMITSVFGMDLFGFNLKDLSREWRKAFSCGAGVRAPEEGTHQECIDIQGNVAEQLAEMMQKKYKIPKEALYRIEKKKKVPFYE